MSTLLESETLSLIIGRIITINQDIIINKRDNMYKNNETVECSLYERNYKPPC